MKKRILSILLAWTFQIFSMELIVECGKDFSEQIQVDTQDSFENVLLELRNQACNGDDNDEVRIELIQKGNCIKARLGRAAAPVARNYYEEVSEQDRKDVYYILRTLSNDSLISIANAKGNLKLAGDRIDHLHPFLFFKIVFSNEELKVFIRNLQGRSWVWREFLDGVIDSFKKEHIAENLLLTDLCCLEYE